MDALRLAIQEGRYEFTLHALQEAADDDLHTIDLESAVLTGRVVRTETDAQRGSKYVIEGLAADLKTPVGVVAR